jgi:hypothetical protein
LIDAQVPHDTDFIYEKTEISEIAPRPNSETMALLYLIYAKNGPVDCVYHKYRIDYQDTNFLKLIQ